MFYSYSGSDFSCAAFFSLYDAERNPVNSGSVTLDSLVTLSISIHEAKSPVRSVGKKNVSGYSSSARTIAGSIIFNIINEHPLKKLLDEYKALYEQIPRWSDSRDFKLSNFTKEYENIQYPTTLPPFNIKIFGITEIQNTKYGFNGSSDYLLGRDNYTDPISLPFLNALITGVEFTGKSSTISVNNILTEDVYEFVALDFQDFYLNYGDVPISESAQENLIYEKMFPDDEDTVDPNILKELNMTKVSPPQKVFNNSSSSKYSLDGNDTFFTQSSTGRKHLAK